ncbi:MAG TPA: PfkB family carbohydrate kinase, partial [Telluria sp.]|nr:PfkB family carbohydrate kinase [Telluria sp.]
MTSPVRIASAGEALIDMLCEADGRYQPCLGGAIFNLTRALARQGAGVAYLNALSQDRFGRALAACLEGDGALLAHPAPVPYPTALAMVSVDGEGHPAYAFYREGVADRALDAHALGQACAALPDLQIVCTGCLALAPADADIYLTWLAVQRRAGRMIVVDANLRPSVIANLEAYRANVLRALQFADLVKVSDEDLEALGVTALDLFDLCPARLVAYTLGKDGAALLLRGTDGSEEVKARETRPLTVVDTVGAGDSFLAGLLVALLVQADGKALEPRAHLHALSRSALDGMLRHAL